MAFIHELTLAEFLAMETTGDDGSVAAAEQDMGALRTAYADQWRPETLAIIPGREGRYALAADWFAAAFLLVRGRWTGAPPSDTRSAWDVAGIFSENLLYLDRPHRGSLLSAELQIYRFEVAAGRVGHLPPYTPLGLIARKSAYRLAIRRAVAAGKTVPDQAMDDYRKLVAEKKARDEAGSSAVHDVLSF